MSYVDGFVFSVLSANKQAYVEYAQETDSLFLDLGAIRLVECWGDEVPAGKITDFARAVQATEEEVVVFSWVEWPDKETRMAAWAKMEELMKTDERFDPVKNPPPFDGKRMIFGGFLPVVMMER